MNVPVLNAIIFAFVMTGFWVCVGALYQCWKLYKSGRAIEHDMEHWSTHDTHD